MGEGGRQAGRGLLTAGVNLQLFPMANLDAKIRDRARALRKHDTQAERILWEALRARRLSGFKFVRQLAIGAHFVDFACRERKLVVEIDGATHGTAAELAHDAKRSEFLKSEGWRVHRAWNQDVFTNLNGVCDSILLMLDEGK
jgi:very-short-patch-repair endonuclease